MNRQGPANQQIRMGFPSVGAAAGRSAIPNGKLASAGGWPPVPPPGVPTPGSRPGLTFSQSVGGLSQPNTPLDMSEFPALGGQPSANPAAAWSRLNTASPQNRGGPPTQQQQQHQQHQIQQDQLDAFPPPSSKDMFGAGMDEFRIGGGVGMGGGGGGSQAQQQQQSQMPPSSMEEFPPLAARATPGAIGGMEGLGGQQQQQQQQHQQQRQGMGSRLMPQMDGMMPQQQGVMQMGETEKKNLLKGNSSSLVSNGAPGLTNMSPSSIAPPISSQSQSSQHVSPAPGLPRPSQQQHPQQQGLGQSSQKGQGPGSLNGDNFNDARGEGTGLLDNPYGLTHLVRRLRNESGNDLGALASGQDLTNLGLDLNQPDTHLWPSFASPFVDMDTKPLEPEFYLPSCYTVKNTQPLATKLQSFSDETLFYIFYTMPRDLMQEVVAAELAQRNWRYHMIHQLWLTKDPRGHVEQLSESTEKGVYFFFDPMQWEKIPKEIILEYTHLDPRTTGSFVGLQGHPSAGVMRHGL